MMETKKPATEEQHEITISWSTFLEGMSMMYDGAMKLIQSLDPVTVAKLAAPLVKSGNDAETCAEVASVDGDEAFAEVEEPVGNPTDAPAEPDVPVEATAPAEPITPDEPAAAQKAAPAKKQEKTTTLTVDDITKVVVQKVKQNPGINEKVRALVVAHGASRVTELPESEYEAFLTDLAQL